MLTPETTANLAEMTAERNRLRHLLKMALSIVPENDKAALSHDWHSRARAALADTTPLAPDPLREAAPKLLAALKAIVRESDKLPEDEFRQAVEAIAKAEGRP